MRNTFPSQTRETADKKKKEKKPLMAIFQKSQRGSLASATIKAIFTLILGLPAEHKETTVLPLGQKETLLCVLLALQVQRPPRQPCHLLSIKDEQEQMAAKVPAGDPGSYHTQTRTYNRLIPSLPATTLPPSPVPVDIKTTPFLPELATCESPAGQFVAAVFSAICSLTSPVPPRKAQKTGSDQFLQVGRWLAGKKSPEEGTQVYSSRPHQVRSFTLEIIN